MKTIFQKDLRENFKIALIGLAIFSLLLIDAYQGSTGSLRNLLGHNGSVLVSSLQPLLTRLLLTEAAFFCAIFGAGLGWLQTRNEAHRDLWAFLIHRPVSRTAIFQAKSAAGLCLYVSGAGLPLLVLVLVVQMPGHVAAPFEWPMVLPLLAIFLTGVSFYFAGLLTGLRQARWFGSRCFGLGWAILAVAAAFTVSEFWQSLLMTMLTVVILAVAVWGAYQSGGFYRGQSMMGKLALVLAVMAGSSVTLFVAVGLTVMLAVQPFTHNSRPYEYYQMTRDGNIYKETMQDNELKAIVDLDGHPLMDSKTGRPMERREFELNQAVGVMVDSRLNNPHLYDYSYLKVMRFFNLWNVVNKKLWYVNNDGKLVGYDGVTRKFLGTLEPHALDGTVVNEKFLPPPRQYDYYYRSYYEDSPTRPLATAGTVYQIDLKARTVKPIYSVTNDDEIGGFDEGGFANQIVITTRKTIRLLKADGESILELPYTPAFVEYPQISISYLGTNNTDYYKNAKNFAVKFYPDYRLNEKSGWKMPEHILWITADNQVSRSLDLPVLRQPDIGESWPEKVATALAPPALVIPSEKHLFKFESLLSCAFDLVCVVIGWRLTQRYHFSTGAKAGWIILILLLGIPGLLTFLCVQEWPVRETCPNCRKLRVIDREICEYCAAEFAPPEKNGTEIFEPLVKI